MTAYGDALRAAREGRGLTLRELAGRLAVSAPHLGEVETGGRGPLGPERDLAIAAALGIPAGRIEVLRSVARGLVSVEGLGEREVARVIRVVRRMREGRQ